MLRKFMAIIKITNAVRYYLQCLLSKVNTITTYLAFKNESGQNYLKIILNNNIVIYIFLR